MWKDSVLENIEYAICSRWIGLLGNFTAAVARPELLDVAVGHAGDVVGYGAGQSLGDLRLVVVRQQGRIFISAVKSPCTTSVA